MLTPADRTRLEAAIRDAERSTAGEIVVVLAAQASRYRALPFLYALLAALVAPWPVVAWTDLSVARVLIVQLAASLAVVAACSWPPLRLALVPRSVLRARAREAAQHEFRSRGMAETRGRTGVLLFVAEAERHAEVIGDVAIAGKVAESAWRSVIETLVDAFRRGETADGLVRAVGAVGAILAEHVPPEAGDTDELPNRVVLL